MDWIDVKAQLRIAICDLHLLQQVVVDDDCYNMTWCIPHVVTDTLSLHTEPDYQHLMKNSQCSCKVPFQTGARITKKPVLDGAVE